MKSKAILTIFILTIAITSGCLESSGNPTTSIGQPEIISTTYRWGQVTQSETEIITDITIRNPNPVSIPIKDIRTTVTLNNIDMATMEPTGDIEIKPQSDTTITLSAKLNNGKLPQWWVTHINNNEKSTLDINGVITFDLKLTDYNYPFKLSNPIRTDLMKSLNSVGSNSLSIGGISIRTESESTWGTINEGHTELITTVTTYNDNPPNSLIPFSLPLIILKSRAFFEMNDIRLAESTSDKQTMILPGSSKTVTYITKIDNSKLNEWWVSHIKNDETTSTHINIQSYFDVGVYKHDFPALELGSEFTTDMLGE